MLTIELITIVVIIVLLFILKKELWLFMLFASLILSILSGVTPQKFFIGVLHALSDISTIRIVASIYLIITLGTVLATTGYFKKLINSLGRLLPDLRFSIVIPPALLGLLPMPAGAMMSAPMVKETGKKFDLSPEDMTFFNYWFRHIWEYSWPLYPGLILAATLVDLPITTLAIRQSPMIVLAASLGLLFLCARIAQPEIKPLSISPGAFLEFFTSIWPILSIIILVIVLKINLVAALISVLILCFAIHKMRFRMILKSLKDGFAPKTLLLIVSVMVFKKILEISGIVTLVPQILMRYSVPVTVPLFLSAFFAGFVTGINSAFVGISFPIFLSVLKSDIDLTFFAYISGFAGVLLSPVHLCLVVTKEYYKANLAKVYIRLLPVVILLLSFGIFIAYVRGIK